MARASCKRGARDLASDFKHSHARAGRVQTVGCIIRSAQSPLARRQLRGAPASTGGTGIALAARVKPRLLLALVVFSIGACHGTSSGDADGGTIALTDGGAGDAPDLQAPPPVTTTPQLLVDGTGLYPRVIRIATGAGAGGIVASVVAPQASGRMGGTILASHDDGLSFTVIGHVDDDAAAGGLCCATLWELPSAVGNLAAGTLLWSASVDDDNQAAPMAIVAWSSSDGGKSWQRLATVATAAVARSKGGLWEPEFSQLADGTLVCHYSDETDPAHSQKLVERRSSDGVGWSAPTATVAPATVGYRPGMANVRRLPDGSYVMSYEVCGVGGDNCTAHLRRSADGWNWGSATDLGLRPATVDGMHFAHAPTLAWADHPGNGRLYLVGQMVYDGAGNVAPGNGQVVLANSEGGNVSWWELAAPVPVKAPYDNFCPNYSSPLLPLDGGAIGLEVATQWDGNVCRAYFARGRLLGSGGSDGVASGNKDRLVNVMSGLCLDVSGGAATAGTKIQQWTCNGLAPQNWTLAAASDGSFALRAENSGLCLAVAAGPSGAGAAIEQQPCDGSAPQRWSPRNVGAGYFTLAHDGLCLDDSGGSTTAGTPMQLWSCNDLSPQIWHFEPR